MVGPTGEFGHEKTQRGYRYRDIVLINASIKKPPPDATAFFLSIFARNRTASDHTHRACV